MKRAFSWIIVLCMILTLIPASVFAASTGTCGDNVTWTLDGGVLTISGTGPTYDYGGTSGQTPWHSVGDTVKTIVVTDGVTAIGEKLFAYLRFATSAELPDSVTELGASAFHTCEKLAQLRLSPNITTIGESCFAHCKALTALELPQGLREIPASCFWRAGLETITVPEGVETIGEEAFKDCRSLENIVFPDSATELGESCLSYTTKLQSLRLSPGLKTVPKKMLERSGITELVLPAGVTSIGANAFSYCTALADISIPDSVTEIGESCFESCTALSTVELPPELTTISMRLFDSSGIESIAIPDGVTTVKNYAFYGCDKLKEVTFPEQMPTGFLYAFQYCDALAMVELPETTTEIYSCMFMNSGLQWLRLPDGVTKIGPQAFANASELETLVVPASVESVWNNSFTGADKLTIYGWEGSYIQSYCEQYDIPFDLMENLPDAPVIEEPDPFEPEDPDYSPCGEYTYWKLEDGVLSIIGNGPTYDYTTLYNYNDRENVPWYADRASITRVEVAEGVTRLGDGLFKDHEALTAVTLPAGLKALGDEVFGSCGSLPGIELPDGLLSLGKGVFFMCRSLTSIELPESLETLDDSAFAYSALTAAAIPAGVTELPDQLFEGCEQLSDVLLPDGVTDLGQYAFHGCTALQTVDLPAALELIEWGCFQDSGLVSLEIPDGVTRVRDYAFSLCRELSAITIPDSVTHMGDYCFSQTDSLKRVELPANLQYLPWGMFSDSGIEEVVFPTGETVIQDWAFSGCQSLTSISIPDNVTFISDLVFNGCTNLKTVELPDSITFLSLGLFQNSGLEELVIPDSVTFTRDYVFSGCDSLRSITYPDGPFRFGDYAFYGCEGVESFDLPEGLDTIGYGMFYGCTGLKEFVIPDTVTTLQTQAFYDTPNLTKLVVPSSVYLFGSFGIFNDVSALTVYCWENSGMHYYAEANGIPYVLMDAEPENPFTDVSESDFYYEPVLWAMEQGITTGTGPDTFSPNSPCQRAQVVTFLWRAMGCPEPKLPANPFTDVRETDFYYKAVLWAVETGITNGMTATTFGPNAVCNRAQVVTFLHRALGKPAAESAVNAFTDVHPGDYYYDAVLWAAATGVTSGVDAVTFAPERDCVRGQVVTFLYRAFAE